MSAREVVKRRAGQAVVRYRPGVRFENSVFSLSHMRAGTTALSNVLCSHSAISGYGEAHIHYDSEDALGRLVVNQIVRRARKPGAPLLHDKILHDRYTSMPADRFFASQGIFIVREPLATIESIRRLFATIDGDEYPTDAAAADYYLRRVEHLVELWRRFPPDRRIAFRTEEIFGNPDGVLDRLSAFLELPAPLTNSYASSHASRRRGAGDPLTSGQHSSIQSVTPKPDESVGVVLDDRTVAAVRAAHADAIAAFGR